MKNKKVWLVSVLLLLIVAGLSFIFIAYARMGVYSSFIATVVIFAIAFAFLLTIALIYKSLYQPKVYEVATITKRFWAFALDYLFIHILFHVLSVLVVIFIGNFKENYNSLINALYGGRNEWFVTELGIMGVYCLYSIGMDFKGGTLGRKAMDALVVGQKNTYATLPQHIVRNFVKWLMFVPVLFLLFMPFIEIYIYEFYFLRMFLVVYIYPKLNPERLFLQDFLSGTKVLDTKYGLAVEIK